MCAMPSALCARDAVVTRGGGALRPFMPGPISGLRRGLILDGAFSLAVRSRELKSFTRELSDIRVGGREGSCLQM